MAARKKTAPKPTKEKARAEPAAFEPSVRRFVSWTTELIVQAEQSADSGNLRNAALLCEWLLTDDRVQSTLNTRVQALLGLEPTFEASGDKRRAGRAIKALDAGEDWWASYPETESALMLKWGLVLGLGPAQHSWDEDGKTKRLHPLPEFWHPYHVSFDTGLRQWRTWVSTEGNGSQATQVDIDPGGGQWVLHCPYGKNRPWAWGLWHALAPLVLLKQLARQDWTRASEKAGILALTMELGAAKEFQNQSRQQRQQLANDIYNRGRNAVTALPPGVDLKLVQTVANTEALFNAQIDMANTAIAVLIRGGNLGTENKGGSRSATESQERTGDLTNLRFDAQSWTTTVHDQSLVWWAQFNFGDQNLAPWPVYPVEPEADLGAKTKADSQALANVDTAEKLGFAVNRQEFLEEHKIAWCKPGERPPKPEPPKPATVPNDPTEVDPGAGGGSDPSLDGGTPANGEPGPVPGDKARAHTGRDHHVRDGEPGDGNARGGLLALASGASLADSSGFVAGQLYVDAVSESYTVAARKELSALLSGIESDIAAAEDYEDLRARLHKRYEDLNPDDLNVLVQQALILGEFAGRAAVKQDT